jgi:hypothetical protein
MDHVVEHLLTELKALSSNPSTATKAVFEFILVN